MPPGSFTLLTYGQGGQLVQAESLDNVPQVAKVWLQPKQQQQQQQQQQQPATPAPAEAVAPVAEQTPASPMPKAGEQRAFLSLSGAA